MWETGLISLSAGGTIPDHDKVDSSEVMSFSWFWEILIKHLFGMGMSIGCCVCAFFFLFKKCLGMELFNYFCEQV